VRIGIARIWQETNTFSPQETTLDHFHRSGVYLADEVLAHLDQCPELAGAIAAAGACADDVEPVPIMAAMAWPAGRVTRETFEYLRSTFCDCLGQCGQLDGLLLSLHGALSGQDCDDAEGELLHQVRQHRGEELPVAISLDMHANITTAMMDSSNIAVGYHTCPHLDVEETGRRAAEILIATAAGRAQPTMAWRKLPMVVPADRHNHLEGPLEELVRRIEQIEQMPEVLSCSVFAVQPWLDVEELGWSVVVVTDGRAELAGRLADDMAQRCWERRERFFVDKVSPKAAVKKAMEISGRPVVISDSADSTNSGAPGNSTWLLKEIMEAGVSETVFLTMVAPEAARDAHRSGSGATINAEMGAAPANPYTRPVELPALVASLHDGTIRLSGHLGGMVVKMGKTAVLETGSIKIVVSEAVGPGHVPPEFFKQLNLDVNDAKIIVAKSPVGFRASYESMAAGVILCEGPGPACSDLTSLNFVKRPKPLYPFDRNLQWSATGAQGN